MLSTSNHNDGGDEQVGGAAANVQGVVEVKFHRQRPFALLGSSGTMAVHRSGDTGVETGELSPSESFI
jgi:hypothetical protein